MQILNVARWLLSDGNAAGLAVCRVKNKFGLDREDVVGGYRDLTLNVVYTG